MKPFPTAMQRINYPVHHGRPNTAHGKIIFVGRIPGACYDRDLNGGAGGSLRYETEDEAIAAAILGGAEHLQRLDCTFVDIAAWKLARAVTA